MYQILRVSNATASFLSSVMAILACGGEVRFNSRVTDLVIENGYSQLTGFDTDTVRSTPTPVALRGGEYAVAWNESGRFGDSIVLRLMKGNGVPAAEELRSTAYEKLLPPLVAKVLLGGNALVWHMRLGLSVGALILFRLLWGMVGGRWSLRSLLSFLAMVSF